MENVDKTQDTAKQFNKPKRVAKSKRSTSGEGAGSGRVCERCRGAGQAVKQKIVVVVVLVV